MPWRVYRPAVVVGHSETGEMDKIDGPYYFFPLLKRLRDTMPGWMPLLGVDLGRHQRGAGRLRRARDGPHRTQARPRRPGVPPRQPRADPHGRAGQHPRGRGQGPALRRTRGPQRHRPAADRRCSPASCAPPRCWARPCAPRRCTRRWIRPSDDWASRPRCSSHVSFPSVFASRSTEKALAGLGDLGARPRVLRLHPVVVVGGDARRLDQERHRRAARAGEQDRRDHRCVLRHRPGHRRPGRQGRRDPDPGGPGPAEARGDPAQDRAAGRHGVRLSVRPLRPRRDRRAHQGAAQGLRPHRLRGQQRRPLHPALAEAERGPVPRLRADHAAQLLRRHPAGDGSAAADARAEVGPRREHLLHRGAHQPAAVLGVRRLQGRPRRVEQRRVQRARRATASPSPASTCRSCARR